MMEGSQAPERDDRAWPKGAIPISLLIAIAAVGVGGTLAVNDARHVIVGLTVVVGAVVTAALMVAGFRRWFAGEPFPAELAIFSGGAASAGVILFLFDRTVGGALLAGLVTGCMLGNVWAILKARQNRT